MSSIPAAEQRPGPRGRTTGQTVAAVAVVTAAMAVRKLMFAWESDDYRYFLHPWYTHIADHGGFRALSDIGFSDYNVPYLYVLAALSHLPVQDLAGIKTVSTLFDLLTAFFAYRIVALRHPGGSWRPPLAGAVVLFLPTVVANSGWWGQADSVYSSFALGGVYLVLRHRPWWACAFLGVALAFKLQTVFVFPFLLVLLLTRRVPWRALLAVPAVYLLLDVPALLLGADPGQLLSVYSRQTGTYQTLSMNAPTVYLLFQPGDHADGVRRAGILVTGAVVLALVAWVVLRRAGRGPLRPGGWARELTDTQIVLLATTSVILVPFLLPSMHERYFFLADVLSVVAAFYLPGRLWYLPVLVQLASAGTYLQYLAHDAAQYTKVELFGALMALAMVAAVRATALEFRRTPGGDGTRGGDGARGAEAPADGPAAAVPAGPTGPAPEGRVLAHEGT
ncbi:glycosyltransferase 87 family protein [Kitasatospora sp. NPDC057015]|uniref:glycosyltransferase 87 family protein n=1 Tax=Kitasatospora sp. NPDC057015 TaxID=3346001 RepID=UPI003637AB1E